jgi:hypothetical protein
MHKPLPRFEMESRSDAGRLLDERGLLSLLVFLWCLLPFIVGVPVLKMFRQRARYLMNVFNLLTEAHFHSWKKNGAVSNFEIGSRMHCARGTRFEE